jgi:hypothetical protein
LWGVEWSVDRSEVGKVWVLDTETKGTGAEMVPLEKAKRRSGGGGARQVIAPKPKPRAEPTPAPRGPLKFKVVDVMTRLPLAEDSDTRTTLEALEGVRSVVDVRIYAWREEDQDWKPLTFDEKKRLWNLRGAAKAA